MKRFSCISICNLVRKGDGRMKCYTNKVGKNIVIIQIGCYYITDVKNGIFNFSRKKVKFKQYSMIDRLDLFLYTLSNKLLY